MSKLSRNIFIETILNILYFPLWWYSKGLKKTFLFVFKKSKKLSKYLGLKILFAYLFKPMFGQYDFKGRIISFFMRCLLLGWRLFLFLLGILGLLTLLIIYIILPILSIWQIIKLT